MPQAILTLTSDFGLSDHYVGVMKGVIASIAPAATVIDLTHGIAAVVIWIWGWFDSHKVATGKAPLWN